MADTYYGEIRLFPYLFVPQNWLPCDGSLHQISQYNALYAVIGTQYGGDGSHTFAVPDLRARVAVQAGQTFNPSDPFNPQFAQFGGTESMTLDVTTVPSHSHDLVTGITAPKNRVATPTGNYVGPLAQQTGSGTTFINAQSFTNTPSGSLSTLNSATLSPFTGGMGSHENRQPYLAMQYCICAYGDNFPSRQ